MSVFYVTCKADANYASTLSFYCYSSFTVYKIDLSHIFSSVLFQNLGLLVQTTYIILALYHFTDQPAFSTSITTHDKRGIAVLIFRQPVIILLNSVCRTKEFRPLQYCCSVSMTDKNLGHYYCRRL